MDQIDVRKAIFDGKLGGLRFSYESLDCGQEKERREGLEEER